MLTKEKVKVKMKTKLQRTKLMSQALKNDQEHKGYNCDNKKNTP